MSEFNLYNEDNIYVMQQFIKMNRNFDLIYSDMIYENLNLDWIDLSWQLLKDNGIMIVQTDFHSECEVGMKMKGLPKSTFVNHIVWKCEWGNHPKDRFHQCYDDIIIFCKGNKWNFYSDRVQVSKATVNTKLNPSGRQTKTATAWIEDICLTTTSKERVKKEDGHLVRWQKPVKLFDRIVLPFTDIDHEILDNFAGTASLGVWCIQNFRKYVGIEHDREVYELAQNRLYETHNNLE